MHSSNKNGRALLQPYAATPRDLPEITTASDWVSAAASCPRTVHTSQAELLDQIARAFQKPPSVARILHGDRRIRQGGRGRRTALFPSSKCGGNIPLESQLELGYAVALERSPDVQEYRTQAIRIPLPGGGFSYPDFLIRTISGTFEVHEVKPSIEHLTLADAQRFNIVGKLLAQVGVGFRLIDARSLPSGVLLENLLLQYSRGHIQIFSKAQIDLAKSLLTRRVNCTFSEACELLVEHDIPAQMADFLIFHQQWRSDQPGAAHSGLGGAR